MFFLMQSRLSEEGASHLTEDGWAETQERVKSICTQLVDLGVVVDAIPNRVASDFAVCLTVVFFQSRRQILVVRML